MRRHPRPAIAPVPALLLLLAMAGCVPPPTTVASTNGAPDPGAAAAPRPARNTPDRVVQFLGKAPADVTAALGQPVLRRAESGGEVWLYAHANGCSVDIVMFPAGAAAKVAHATTRTPAKLAEKDCLQSIASEAP